MEGGSFLYQPLDRETGEIRLLTLTLLQPNADKKSIIEVEMHHVPLDKAKRTYLALSYTWGDAKTSNMIRLNGQDIEVRDNLYDFLIRYRECMTDRRDGLDLFETYELTEHYSNLIASGFYEKDELKYSEMGEPVFLQNMPIWIDALSMDQENGQELNDNVPRMKDIYEKAEHVIVWLGNETETSKEAMTVLQQARMRFGQDRHIPIFAGIIPGAGEADSRRLGPAANLDEWKAVAKFFEHPYWKRMWVVQELAYTFRFASIWCGRRQMHAHSLAKVQRAYFGDELGDTGMRDYTHPRYDRANNVPLSLVRGGTWPIAIVHDLADKPNQLAVAGARSTREIMSMTRTRKASVPHDMIYALYRLIVPGSDKPLIVDYNRSVAQVFCDYMEYELAVSKSLQIWQLLTEKKSTIEGLPSWAVDWTEQDERHQSIHIKTAVTPQGPKDRQATRRNVINFASMQVPELISQTPDVNYAAGTTTATVRIVEPSRKIAVTGYVIGQIDGGGGKFKDVKHPDDADTSFWEDLDDACSLLRDLPWGDIEKVLQVGSCLLFDSRIQFSDPKDETYIRYYGDHILDIVMAVRAASPIFDVHFENAINQLFMTCMDESKVDKIPQRPQGAMQVYQESKQKVRQNFWDRSWIMNKQFGVLGLASARARQGDMLFVPHGCPFVMVFRDEGDGTFSVIGTCWLYGFMHGEAVKMHADGILEEREIVLV